MKKIDLAEKMHNWYLEATKELHPESFNKNAQKLYSELTDEQKFIDKYIAQKISELVRECVGKVNPANSYMDDDQIARCIGYNTKHKEITAAFKEAGVEI